MSVGLRMERAVESLKADSRDLACSFIVPDDITAVQNVCNGYDRIMLSSVTAKN